MSGLSSDLPERRPFRLVLSAAALLAALVLAAWSAGFAWFLRNAAQPGGPPPEADGIVALTGGAERIDTALRLLAAGRARRLLISGVRREFDLADLTRLSGLDAGPLAGRITLGRSAISTYGNAAETAAWARENGIRTLIVVTAAYHMPRALTEIGHALPEARLYPVAVVPPPRPGTNDSGSLGMLAGEYTKWLASQAGLGFLSRRHSGL